MSSKRQSIARRLASKKFRRTLKRADIANGISFQLKALMHARGWNQRDLARESGIAQPLLSKYLKGYESYSVQTLDKLADAFDVSLGVRFETYGQLVDYHIDLSPERLLVPRYDEDTALREMQSASSGSMIAQTLPRQIMPGRTLAAHQALLPGQDPRVISLPERRGTVAGKVEVSA